MDKDIIRAYLWQEIIRLAFSPSSTKEQKTWLALYAKSLKNFWEVGTYPGNPREYKGRLSIIIDNLFVPNVCFECTIESMQKFSVRCVYENDHKVMHPYMLLHDMDGQDFDFPRQTFLTCCGKGKVARKKFSDDDIEAVVDGLLLHPAVHMHVESPFDYHEIRLGTGIDNPFQYLFHLRYQLCLFNEKRQAERVRLITLFSDAIRSQSRIPPNSLMDSGTSHRSS